MVDEIPLRYLKPMLKLMTANDEDGIYCMGEEKARLFWELTGKKAFNLEEKLSNTNVQKILQGSDEAGCCFHEAWIKRKYECPLRTCKALISLLNNHPYIVAYLKWDQEFEGKEKWSTFNPSSDEGSGESFPLTNSFDE